VKVLNDGGDNEARRPATKIRMIVLPFFDRRTELDFSHPTVHGGGERRSGATMKNVTKTPTTFLSR
jgi:hypothetical protein